MWQTLAFSPPVAIWADSGKQGWMRRLTSLVPHQILSLYDSRLSVCPLGELSFSVRDEDLSIEAADSTIPFSLLFIFSGLSV